MVRGCHDLTRVDLAVDLPWSYLPKIGKTAKLMTSGRMEELLQNGHSKGELQKARRPDVLECGGKAPLPGQ